MIPPPHDPLSERAQNNYAVEVSFDDVITFHCYQSPTDASVMAQMAKRMGADVALWHWDPLLGAWKGAMLV